MTPKDYDLFMVTARRAIEALKHACEVDNWAQRFFDDYAPRLHEWCKAHADQIGACYVAIKAPSLKVFVVAKTNYDQALGVEIAEF